MTDEYKTLAELNVQPGDVVDSLFSEEQYNIRNIDGGLACVFRVEESTQLYRIISRAADSKPRDVPNEEKTPLKDMSPEDQAAIFQAMIDERLEKRLGDDWFEMQDIHPDGVYRTEPAPLVHDTVPWDVLTDDVICAVRDARGEAFAHTSKPKVSSGGWWYGDAVAMLNHIKGYKRGTINWKDSLQWRPGYEPSKE